MDSHAALVQQNGMSNAMRDGRGADAGSPVPDRSALWLPLLAELTVRCQRWAVLKNVDSALRGTGDLDSIAESTDWPLIQQIFVAWAEAHDLGPVVVCRCRQGGPRFITFQPGSPYIVQLDVMDRRPFRGSPFLPTERLLALTVMEPRGFRTVRPGVEGAMKMCLNGIRPGGRCNAAGLTAKGVQALLLADPEGVREASMMFGIAKRWLVSLADAVAAGEWNHSAAAAVDAWATLRGLANPGFTIRQFWYRNVAPPCAMKLPGRRVPAELAGYLREHVAPRHQIIRTSGANPGLS